MDIDQKSMTVLSKGIPQISVYKNDGNLEILSFHSDLYTSPHEAGFDRVVFLIDDIKAMILPANRVSIWAPDCYSGNINALCRAINEKFHERYGRIDADPVHLCGFVFEFNPKKQTSEYLFMGLKAYREKVEEIIGDVRGAYNIFALRQIGRASCRERV